MWQTSAELHALEAMHHKLSLYRWLNIRFGDTRFPQRPEATLLARDVEAKMKAGLEALTQRNMRQRTKFHRHVAELTAGMSNPELERALVRRGARLGSRSVMVNRLAKILAREAEEKEGMSDGGTDGEGEEADGEAVVRLHPTNPETEELWQRLLDDPSQWWDNRVTKHNPKGPDFKHKVSKQPLWLNSCPPHFVAQVNAIPISGSTPAGRVPAGAAVVGGAGAYQTQNASTGTSQYTDSGMGGAFGAQGGAGNGSATSGEGGYPTAGYPVDGLGYGGGGDAEEEIPF